MSANHSVSIENAQKGLFPFKALRRQTVRFAPYPYRMLRNWAINASNRTYGEGAMVRVLPDHGPIPTRAAPETLLSTGLGSWL